MHADADQITALLGRIGAGDAEAADLLMALVYKQLHRLASQLQPAATATPTLGPTAIVHEAYVKLVRSNAMSTVQDRRHFYSLACRAMRQVIVDYARSRATCKRSNGRHRIPLEAVLAYFAERKWDVLALHEALEILTRQAPRKGQVVDLKFFGGLKTAEIASTLCISVSTVEEDWRFARAFLRAHMDGGEFA